MRHPLLRLLAMNALAGALAAVVVVVGMLSLDVGGIGRLVANAENPAVAVALFTCGFVILLSNAAMGVAIMRLGAVPRDDGPGGGRPIPVRVAAGPRR